MILIGGIKIPKISKKYLYQGEIPYVAELFKLYDIYDNKSQCNQLLLLWCDIKAINCCVNDTATCESCKKDLEQYWKCCDTCPNAICYDCQNCQDCQEYIDSFGIDC